MNENNKKIIFFSLILAGIILFIAALSNKKNPEKVPEKIKTKTITKNKTIIKHVEVPIGTIKPDDSEESEESEELGDHESITQ